MSNEVYEQIKDSIWRTHEMLLKITSEPIALEITNKWLADLEKVRNR